MICLAAAEKTTTKARHRNFYESARKIKLLFIIRKPIKNFLTVGRNKEVIIEEHHYYVYQAVTRKNSQQENEEKDTS